MAFLDKITKVTQDAVRGAKDMTDVARLNSLISDEEKKIDALFKQIGKTYYNNCDGEIPEAFSELFASVKEAEEKILGYHEDIKKIKGSKNCANCGASNPSNSSFCISCGAPMEAQAEVAPAQKFCTSCGAAIEPGAAFCLSCGAKL